MAIDKARFDALVECARRLLVALEFPGTYSEHFASSYEMLLNEMPNESSEELIRRAILWSGRDLVQWDALCKVASERIRSGEPLTPDLRAWAADVLSETRTAPGHGKPGRPSENRGRDAIVVCVIREVAEEFGLTPTRDPKQNVAGAKGVYLPNPCREGGSAADVVGCAARELGLHLRIKGLESIWRNYRKSS